MNEMRSPIEDNCQIKESPDKETAKLGCLRSDKYDESTGMEFSSDRNSLLQLVSQDVFHGKTAIQSKRRGRVINWRLVESLRY